MRRMVYGVFTILFVALLITTFWVTSIHSQYSMGLGSGYQRRTISIASYLSPDVSGDFTLRTRSIFYQERSEYVRFNGTFLIRDGTPMNVTVTEFKLYIMNVPDPDDFWDTVYINYNFLELYNTTGFSISGSYEISIGSLGNHSLGFGIHLRLFDGTTSELCWLGKVDILPIFVIPGFLWPDFWYLTTSVMIILGCVLLVQGVLKWFEIID